MRGYYLRRRVATDHIIHFSSFPYYCYRALNQVSTNTSRKIFYLINTFLFIRKLSTTNKYITLLCHALKMCVKIFFRYFTCLNFINSETLVLCALVMW